MTAGASMRHVAPTPWSDAEREQLRRMRENGLSMAEIGRMLGRSKNSVHRQMANLGLVHNERTPAKRPGAHPKVARPHAPRSTLPRLPSLMMDD